MYKVTVSGTAAKVDAAQKRPCARRLRKRERCQQPCAGMLYKIEHSQKATVRGKTSKSKRCQKPVCEKTAKSERGEKATVSEARNGGSVKQVFTAATEADARREVGGEGPPLWSPRARPGASASHGGGDGLGPSGGDGPIPPLASGLRLATAHRSPLRP